MLEFIDFKKILEKIEAWLAEHTHKKQKQNFDPVLLVPGIGASILNAVDKNGHKERVWVRILGADHEFQQKLWSMYDVNTGKTVSLDPNSRIEVPDDNYGLYACDILDPALIIRLNVVYNFHDLIKEMVCWGYEEGTSLFGYGFDFRQSNRLLEAVEGLRLKLEDIHKVSGGKKVNIISHSMGGLLVKSFVAMQPDVFDKLVNSWITISTPFQGAPGFVTDCLLTGVEFLKGWQKDLWVAKWSTHQLLVECPSIYEILTSLTHEWERCPELQVWRNQVDENGEQHIQLDSYGPQQSIPIIQEALKDNTLTYDGKEVAIPFNTSILKWADDSRRMWQSTKLPKGFKFYNIFGTSIPTPFDVCYGSQDKPITQLKEILHTEATFGYVDGDGTVPAESSVADGMEAVMRMGIAGSHRGMLRSQQLFHILKNLLQIDKSKPEIPLQTQQEEKEYSVQRTQRFSLHHLPKWDTVSEDSEDYMTEEEEEEEEEKEEMVESIEMENVRAEVRVRLSRDNEGCMEAICEGVAEGNNECILEHTLNKAFTSVLEKTLKLKHSTSVH